MTIFWIVAALLLGGALLFLLPPLIKRSVVSERITDEVATLSVYRDQVAELEADLRVGNLRQEEFEQGKRELERRLLDDVPSETPAGSPAAETGRHGVAAVVTGIAVPVSAVLLYLLLGNPDAMSPEKMAAAKLNAGASVGGEGDHQVTPEQIQKMVAGLAEKLKANPNDLDGWRMLARSYTMLERFAEAEKAYAKALELAPKDPDALTDYADILALVNGRNLNGKPMELVQAALAIQPSHQKALALAGSAAFNNKDFKGAAAYWQQLLKTVPSDSEGYRFLTGSIAQAQALAEGKVPPQMPPMAQEAPPAAPPAAENATQAAISGTVSLSPALAGKVAPTDSVFIFARAVSGPRMPLAIVLVQVKDLPKTFTLNDSLAMNPAMKLSNFPEVTVGARVSKSGGAMPQSGDLQGSVSPVKLGASGLKVVIESVVP